MRQPIHRSIIEGILTFSQRHALLVIILTLLLTVLFGYFMLKVELNTDLESLIPEDDEFSRLLAKYGDLEEHSDYLLLGVESEDLFTVEKLQILDAAIGRIAALELAEIAINPFDLVTFRKAGRRLEVIPASPGGRAPSTEQELVSFRKNLLADPFASKLLVSPDGSVLSAIFSTGRADEYDSFMESFSAIVSDLEEHFSVHTSSFVQSNYLTKVYLMRDFPKLLGLTLLFILVVFYLGFRAKRSVILPTAVVGCGTIWCLGFMGMLQYPISVVSITTPPLVLILGSSYTIHILNQYYREIRAETEGKGWIVSAVSHVNATILLAALTTVIGFGSLLATNMQQSREFGLSTSVGIIACAVLSLFFLPAALSKLRTPTVVQRRKILEGPLSKIMGRWSRIVTRRRLVFIALFIATVVLFVLLSGQIGHQSEYIEYFPQGEKFVQDTYFFVEKLGGFQRLNVTVTAPEGQENYFLDLDVLERISLFEQRLRARPEIYDAVSFVTYIKHLNELMSGRRTLPETRGLVLLLSRYFKLSSYQSEGQSAVSALANDDFSRLTVTFRVYDPERERYLYEDNLRRLIAKIREDMDTYLDPATNPELWGISLKYNSLSDIVDRNQRTSMLIAISLIFVVACITFRSVLFGFYTLVPLATGIMLTYVFMALTGIPLDITTVLVMSVTIGVGVDNSIHLLLQFRRQSSHFPGHFQSTISNTLKITGRPILLTTASIVGGLLILTLASFKPIVYFGVLVAFSLLATALGALIVLPAVLSLGHEAREGGVSGGTEDAKRGSA